MSAQLQPFPKNCAKGLDLHSPVKRKASRLLQCLLRLRSDLKDLKLSLCHNSDRVELALFAYQCFSGGAVFYCPAWTLQLPRHSFSRATAGSNSSNKPVDPPARFGQWSSRDEGECSSYLDVSTPCPHHILIHMISPSTSVVLSLESSTNLRKGVENI